MATTPLVGTSPKAPTDKTSGGPPRFRGETSTLTAALGAKTENGFYGSWPLTGPQLFQVVAADVNPYVGQTPMMLQAKTGLSNDQLCHALDDLADQLREREDAPLVTRILHGISPFSIKVPINGREFLVKKIGEGSFGHVYKLSDGERHYAFKVHKYEDEGHYSEHSPYQEAANGLYLTVHHINRDVVRFYASNPGNGWGLLEYIPEFSNTHRREGQTLQEAGFAMSDDHYNNRISKVRVDLGGTMRADDALFDSSTYFRLYSTS